MIQGLKVLARTLLFYFLAYTPFRAYWNQWMQYIFDRNIISTKLKQYETLMDLSQDLMSKFKYRKDPMNGLLDYHSEPGVFLTRLNSSKVKDGDCDDIAWTFALLAQRIPNVLSSTILNVGYKTGAHSVALIEKINRETGKVELYLFNYGLSIVCSPMDAATQIALSYDKISGTLKWLIHEDLNMKPIRIVIF